MNTHSPLVLLAALGALATHGAAFAAPDTAQWKCTACPYPKGATGSVDVGVAYSSDDSARFGDYTGLQSKGGHLALDGDLRYRGEGGYFADVTGSNLGVDARTLSGQSGREGLYALSAAYVQVPRHLLQGALTPFSGVGTGTLTLPAGYGAAGTSTMPLASTLQPVNVGFKRSRLDLAGTFIAWQNWTARVSYRRDVRDGTKSAYGAFFSTATQLVVPVDQVTDELEVSLAWVTRGASASLGYQLSNFSNGVSSVTWDNPFQPVVPGATRGQLAQAPDSQLHQLVGSAGLDITPTLRASADFTMGRLTQNAADLAPTLTPSIAAALPATLPGTLNGKVNLFNGNVKLTAAPLNDLRLNASYANDVRENNTAVQTWPLIAGDIFLTLPGRSTTPFSITQDRFKASADYRGFENFKLSAGADVDYRQRTYSEVVRTRETTTWGKVGAQPREDLSLSLKVAHADRTFDAYGTATWFGLPENPLMRKYNLAARTRDSAAARLDATVTDKLSVGLGLDYANDSYTRSAVGLQLARSANFSADVAIAVSEKTQLTAYGQIELIHSRQAGSQGGAVADWTAVNDDRFSVFGIGLKHTLLADKLDIGADLSLARSSSDVVIDTALGGPAFPSAKTSMDTLKINATYKLNDNLWITGGLWHEHYESQDWHLDGVLPGTVQNLLSFGAQSPRYNVNVVRVSMRYRF